jgi:large subunit ribosomal protein L33
MAKKGANRSKIILECTEARKMGRPDLVSRYHTFKNKRNSPERLVLMKYNPNLRKYTEHKEIK